MLACLDARVNAWRKSCLHAGVLTKARVAMHVCWVGWGGGCMLAFLSPNCEQGKLHHTQSSARPLASQHARITWEHWRSTRSMRGAGGLLPGLWGQRLAQAPLPSCADIRARGTQAGQGCRCPHMLPQAPQARSWVCAVCCGNHASRYQNLIKAGIRTAAGRPSGLRVPRTVLCVLCLHAYTQTLFPQILVLPAALSSLTPR